MDKCKCGGCLTDAAADPAGQSDRDSKTPEASNLPWRLAAPSFCGPRDGVQQVSYTDLGGKWLSLPASIILNVPKVIVISWIFTTLLKKKVNNTCRSSSFLGARQKHPMLDYKIILLQ